jgi:hypothetical protein
VTPVRTDSVHDEILVVVSPKTCGLGRCGVCGTYTRTSAWRQSKLGMCGKYTRTSAWTEWTRQVPTVRTWNMSGIRRGGTGLCTDGLGLGRSRQSKLGMSGIRRGGLDCARTDYDVRSDKDRSDQDGAVSTIRFSIL